MQLMMLNNLRPTDIKNLFQIISISNNYTGGRWNVQPELFQQLKSKKFCTIISEFLTGVLFDK
jgi:hypothetical protein